MKLIFIMMGISRQGYYKSRKKKQKKQLQSDIILQLVLQQRRKMLMLGGKKLYRLLRPDLERMGIKLGRDKLLDLLSEWGLLIRRKKMYMRTTNSSHHFRVHKNLIKDQVAKSIDEIYVSDITYIRTGESFCYLSLITDLYSRKIVGYDVSESLNIEGSVRSLKMALKGKGEMSGLTHHSDRGLQYCSKKYTKLLTAKKIQISMSSKGNPYENAVAERLNGILKEEFMLSQTFSSKALPKKSVEEAIKTYNEYRPHMSINYMTPNQKYAA